MAQGTPSPPPSVLIINHFKEQIFSKIVGGEVVMKSENNVYFGGGWVLFGVLLLFFVRFFVFNKKLTLAVTIPFCTEVLRTQ